MKKSDGSMEDWVLSDYTENGQDFVLAQRKHATFSTEPWEDGPYSSLARNGRYLIPVSHHDGVPICFNQRSEMVLQQRKQVRFRARDVVVVAYPRSGSTWVEQATLLILKHGDPTTLNTKQKNAFNPSRPERRGKVHLDLLFTKRPGKSAEPWGSSCGQDMPTTADDLEKIPFRRLFKTHRRPHMLAGMGEFPEQLKAKVPPPFTESDVKLIWIIRDPRDVVTSLHRVNIANFEKLGVPFTPFVKAFLEGRIFGGFWDVYTLEWLSLSKRYPRQFLILSYEDNVKNPRRTIEKIAKFLEVELTEQEVQACVKNSSFEAMKEMSRDAVVPHVHYGKAGGWRRKMTQEQNECFNKLCSNPALGSFGSRYIYHE